ncbi:hypothetical protein ABVB68_24565, partial [Streptomyces sp. NPDC096012]
EPAHRSFLGTRTEAAVLAAAPELTAVRTAPSDAGRRPDPAFVPLTTLTRRTAARPQETR